MTWATPYPLGELALLTPDEYAAVALIDAVDPLAGLYTRADREGMYERCWRRIQVHSLVEYWEGAHRYRPLLLGLPRGKSAAAKRRRTVRRQNSIIQHAIGGSTARRHCEFCWADTCDCDMPF